MEKGLSKKQNRYRYLILFFSFLDSEPKAGKRLFFYGFFVFGLKRKTKKRWFFIILFFVSNEKTNYQNVHRPFSLLYNLHICLSKNSIIQITMIVLTLLC